MLKKADEVFLSSTLQEVLGIVSIDDRAVGDGRVGRYTTKLFEEFRTRSRGESMIETPPQPGPGQGVPTDRTKVELAA